MDQTVSVKQDIRKLNLQLTKTHSKSEKLSIFKEFKLLRQDLKQVESQYIT